MRPFLDLGTAMACLPNDEYDRDAMFDEVLAILRPKPRKTPKRFRKSEFRQIEDAKQQVDALERRCYDLRTTASPFQLRDWLKVRCNQTKRVIQQLQRDHFPADLWHLPPELLDSFMSSEDTTMCQLHAQMQREFDRLAATFAKCGLAHGLTQRITHATCHPSTNALELVYGRSNVEYTPATTYANVYWETFTLNLPLTLPGLHVELVDVVDVNTVHLEFRQRRSTHYILKRFQVAPTRTVFITRSFDMDKSFHDHTRDDVSDVTWCVVDAWANSTAFVTSCVEVSVPCPSDWSLAPSVDLKNSIMSRLMAGTVMLARHVTDCLPSATMEYREADLLKMKYL